MPKQNLKLKVQSGKNDEILAYFTLFPKVQLPKDKSKDEKCKDFLIKQTPKY